MTALLDLDRLAVWRSPSTAFVVLGVVGGVVLGAVNAYDARLGFAALAAAILFLLVIRRPANLAVTALLGVFVVQRLGSASLTPGSRGGISYSDAVLSLAAFLALPALLSSDELSRLRVALAGLGVYLSCLMPTVILNSSSRGYLEWAHRLVLVGGGLLVGAWIAREGLTRTSLRLLTFVACVIAVLAMGNSASNGLAAASPLGLNKNFVGGLLGLIIVVVAVAARHIELGQRLQIVAMLLLAGGLLASQSRGGILGAVAGLLVALVLDPRGHSRRVRALSILVALILGVAAFLSIRDQLNQTRADLNNGSIGVRFNVEKVTRQVWSTSPVVGVGLKYFNTGKFGSFAQAANNDVDNELAESGVIGLLGFVALQGTVVAAGVRRRRGGTLVAAGVGVVVAQLLHGMVDIYWTAGVASLPFMIMGMALAGHPPGSIGSRSRPEASGTTGAVAESAIPAARRRVGM